MKEIVAFWCKAILLFLVIFGLIFIESFFCGRSYLLPRELHDSFLRSVDASFIVLGSDYNLDSFILNKSQLLLHTTIHSNYDEISFCQNNQKQKCYIASSFITFVSPDSAFNKTLIKGTLPANVGQICINRNVSERLKLNVGDSLLIKADNFTRVVKVSGIVENFYGIDSFKDDVFSKFCCLTFDDFDYLRNNRGKIFSFTDDASNFLAATSISDDIKNWRVKKYGFLSFLFVLNLMILSIAYLLLYSKILKLCQYYRRLFYLGVSKKNIQMIRMHDTACFFGLCFIEILSIFAFVTSYPSIRIMQILSCILCIPVCVIIGKENK